MDDVTANLNSWFERSRMFVLAFLLIFFFLFPAGLAGGIEFGPDVRVDPELGQWSSGVSNDGIRALGDTVYVCLEICCPEIVYVSRSTDGGASFDLFTQVSEGGWYYRGSTLSVDSTGGIYVVWRRHPEIAFSKSTDHGETFTPPVIMSDSTGHSKSYPTIDTAGSENIYIAWQDYRDDHIEVYFTRSTDGGDTFEPDLRVTLQYAEWEFGPSIAVDGEYGFIYIAWMQADRILLARSSDGGLSFADTFEPMPGLDDVTSVSIKVNEDGILGVMAAVSDAEIYFARSTDHGESFCDPVRVDPGLPDALSQMYPGFFMKEDRVYVAWYDVRQIGEIRQNRFISFSRSTDGGSSFELPVSVADSSTDSVFKGTGGVTVNDNGYIFVAWNDCRVDPFFCERHFSYCSRADETVEIDGVEPSEPVPEVLHLFQNYPNPFNPTTTISFDIPVTVDEILQTNLSIYNLRGKLVRKLFDKQVTPGNHRVVWDGKNDSGTTVSSGLYFYNLKTPDGTFTRKMLMYK